MFPTVAMNKHQKSIHSQEIKDFLANSSITDYYLMDDDPDSPITACLPAMAEKEIELLLKKAKSFFGDDVSICLSCCFDRETQEDRIQGLDFFAI
jgi:hypothetical protein